MQVWEEVATRREEGWQQLYAHRAGPWRRFRVGGRCDDAVTGSVALSKSLCATGVALWLPGGARDSVQVLAEGPNAPGSGRNGEMNLT